MIKKSNLDMPKLPQDVSPYLKTKVFSNDSIPKGLLKDHSTKAGSWGILNVTAGKLHYTILENETRTEFQLDLKHPGIIAPEQLHFVRMEKSTKFFIEFFR